MKLELNERIFIAGSTGMAGSAIFRKLSLEGYGLEDNDGCFLVPNRQELDLLDFESVKNNGIFFPPAGGIFELRFPNDDIVVTVR